MILLESSLPEYANIYLRLNYTILSNVLDTSSNIDKIDASRYHDDKTILGVSESPRGVNFPYPMTAQVFGSEQGLHPDELRQLLVHDKCKFVVRRVAMNRKCKTTEELLLATTNGCILICIQRCLTCLIR